jgi:hypothetical protein
MARCVYCGAETELFLNGIPTCIECDEAHEPKRDGTHDLDRQGSTTDRNARPHLDA